MATENDDSQSMNGILSNISRDVVDTSWDIPPLTFPKLQPTDSEEADGADEASLAEPRTDQAKHIFRSLRALDEQGDSVVYARCPQKDGLSMAVYNRLIRAAAFRVIKL